MTAWASVVVALAGAIFIWQVELKLQSYLQDFVKH
jgi:hypothetical protein